MDIVHVDPGYGRLMQLDSNANVEFIENAQYNPYSGVAFHLTSGSRIYFPNVDFTFEPTVGQTYKKVWSVKFTVYIGGSGLCVGFCHSISAFSNPDVGVHLRKSGTSSSSIRRYIDGTVTEENNFLQTPEGLHNISITYAVTAESTGNYISTSTITIDDTTDYQTYSSATMPDIPQYIGCSFAISCNCYMSNILIGQATYDGEGELPSDDGIPANTPIYRLPLGTPITNFTLGTDEYIATENGQTLLQTTNANNLSTTWGNQPVNHIVVYGNPGYRVGSNVARATGISKAGDTIEPHGTQDLNFDKNTHIYDVWEIAEGNTFSSINDLQVGWRAGD
ncbi:MAG: hypothetical protein IJK81_13320 [Selenomonadaceae bacterium]|nr:hypothetical protein [Selenomonadaceae bacterium]